MPAFLPDYSGWIYQLVNIINFINLKDFKFSIYTRKPAPFTKAENSNLEIDLIRVSPSNQKRGNAANILFILKGILYIIKNRSKIDLLYLPFLFFPGFVFIIAAKALKIPVVGQISGEEIRYKRGVISAIRTKTICKMNLIITLNDLDKIRLIDLDVDKKSIKMIPNNVNPDKFSPADIAEKRKLKNKYNISANLPIICYVGLICHRKGIHILIEAAENLIAKGIEFRLILAGPYRNAAEIEENYVSKMRQKEKVNHPFIHFLGRIDNIEEIYKISDIFVLPSFAEGMPGVLLEAMSSKLTCICSDIDGINDVIKNNENGILFKAGDVLALTNKMEEMLVNKQHRAQIAYQARETAINDYSTAAIAREYEKMFLSLID